MPIYSLAIAAANVALVAFASHVGWKSGIATGLVVSVILVVDAIAAFDDAIDSTFKW